MLFKFCFQVMGQVLCWLLRICKQAGGQCGGRAADYSSLCSATVDRQKLLATQAHLRASAPCKMHTRAKPTIHTLR
uniref:Predicted protein n=1 Tax=Hordeum vulgare subsp. vulgare TaxID=112509 RepID=F2EC49_HORVV|nr:predicted protein [Hordeum vulgare subsp. vulgare]